MVDACASAGILPFYGPFGDIKDTAGLRDPVPRRLPARLRRRLVAAPGPDRDRQEGLQPAAGGGQVREEGAGGDPRRPRRPHDRRQDAGRRHLEAVQGDGRAGRDAGREGPGAGRGLRAPSRPSPPSWLAGVPRACASATRGCSSSQPINSSFACGLRPVSSQPGASMDATRTAEATDLLRPWRAVLATRS